MSHCLRMHLPMHSQRVFATRPTKANMPPGGKMSVRLLVFVALVIAVAQSAFAADNVVLLVRSPTVNRTNVVFVYGGYLWSVPRGGGEARQLTTAGHEGLPIFSPDGKWIAFSGQYDGNIDVFVMPAEGGEPKR